MFNRNIFKESLERELGNDEFKKVFNAFLNELDYISFNSWQDLISYLHDKSIPDEAKDQILKALFTARNTEPDPTWQSVFTLVFWPVLDAVFLQKRAWDDDKEELWHRLYAVFLSVLRKIDPAKRPTGIPTKLFCDTLYHFHKEYTREWKYQEKEFQLEHDDKRMEVSDPVEAFVAVEIEVDFEFVMELCASLIEKDVISGDDFELILETFVVGKKLTEFAAERDLSHEAVKKRRQRIILIIRDHFAKII